MKSLILLSLLAFPAMADFSDVEVLRCGDPGKFILRLVHTDTGDILSLVEKPGKAASNAYLHEAKWDFVNHSLHFQSLIFVFDDALNPKQLTVKRPATSPISGQTVSCQVKETKLYAALLHLGALTIPGDLTERLFAGDYVTVQFLDTKHKSGDFNCKYTFLGDRRQDCHWNSEDRLVTVQFQDGGKPRTHVFMADPLTKTLISASAKLTQ